MDAIPKFSDRFTPVEQHCLTMAEHGRDFVQAIYDFRGGYGMSVVRDWAFGEGYWEVAVLKDRKLCYSTPIANDVVRGLETGEVGAYLDGLYRFSVQATAREIAASAHTYKLWSAWLLDGGLAALLEQPGDVISELTLRLHPEIETPVPGVVNDIPLVIAVTLLLALDLVNYEKLIAAGLTLPHGGVAEDILQWITDTAKRVPRRFADKRLDEKLLIIRKYALTGETEQTRTGAGKLCMWLELALPQLIEGGGGYGQDG